MDWFKRPVRKNVALFYGSSIFYFWILSKEPLNPGSRIKPGFVDACFFDQLWDLFSGAKP